MAEMIRREIEGSELVEVTVKKQPGFLGAGWMAFRNTKPEITNRELDMQPYDLIMIGEPVWGGKPNPFMLTALNSLQNARGKPAVGFFSGGGPFKDNRKVVDLQKERIKAVGMKFRGGYGFGMAEGKIKFDDDKANLKKLVKLLDSQ